MKPRVAVVGAGYWGINHVRAFARLDTAELVAVCDPDEKSLERAAQFSWERTALQTHEVYVEARRRFRK